MSSLNMAGRFKKPLETFPSGFIFFKILPASIHSSSTIPNPANTATIPSKPLHRLTSLLRTMSTTTPTTPSAPAPWKSAFLDHINTKMSSPEFVLSTLHPAPSGSTTPYVPHARYCIFRGMWAELPENKHNDAPRNEAVFESEMPTFTTDVRMAKVEEIFATSAGNVEGADLINGGCGGGGPVEAVWWVKDVMTQWRVKGSAFVVGDDAEGDGEQSSGVRTVKSQLGKGMRVVMPGKEGEWSWKKEVTGHFGNLSPGMRGSFKQPPPGQPKSAPYNSSEEKMGEKLDTLDDAVARKHFRVVVIKPHTVEELNLSPDNMWRKIYTLDEASDIWGVQETWP